MTCVAMAIVLALTVLVVPPAHARVTGVRSTMGCGGGQVKVFAPGVWTDRNQTVFWAAQLHYWNQQRRQWEHLYTSPWAFAGAVNGRIGNSGAFGMPVWFNYGNNVGVGFRAWNGLQGGYYYAVKNWLWTPDGGYYAHWSEYGPGVTYC